MLTGLTAAIVGAVAMLFLLRPSVGRSAFWRATATPLASIVGSGFLVSAPLVSNMVGYWAPPAIVGLLGLAYLIGAAVRENIAHVEPLLAEGHGHHRAIVQIEHLSSVALAFAYFISVAYYLVLFASFLLKIGDVTHPIAVKVVVTIILATIGGLGFWRGFGAVEGVEIHAVSAKLAVIAGLVAALVVYNVRLFADGVPLEALESAPDTGDVAPLLGLLIIVQGFETSRFLGDAYSAQLRIRTMKAAQLISAGIYIAFFLLCLPLFSVDSSDGVAGIVDMLAPVSLVLPAMVILGALASQSSAAIADANGAAGLLHELSGGRILIPYTYPLIAIVAAIITWETDVFGLIALASRAFAFYYALQCVVAALSTRNRGRPGLAAFYAALALLCFAVVIFGAPAEAE